MRREPTEKERFAILLEDLHGQFKIIQEGQNAMEIRLRRTIVEDVKLLFEPRFSSIEKIVQSILEQLKPMQFVLSDHEHRIKKLEAV